MRKMDFVSEELKRREEAAAAKVSGFQRFKKVAKKVSDAASVGVEKAGMISKKIVKGGVSAYEGVQDFRLKAVEKQAKIARAAQVRDKAREASARSRKKAKTLGVATASPSFGDFVGRNPFSDKAGVPEDFKLKSKKNPKSKFTISVEE